MSSEALLQRITTQFETLPVYMFHKSAWANTQLNSVDEINIKWDNTQLENGGNMNTRDTAYDTYTVEVRWYETDEFSANNYTRVFKTAMDALTFVRQLADPKLYSIYIADAPHPRLAVSTETTSILDYVVLSEFTTMEAERRWAEMVTAQLAIRNSNNPLYYWLAQGALGQLANDFQVCIKVEDSNAVLQVVLIDDIDEIVLQRSNSCKTPLDALAVIREWMNPTKWVVHDEMLITVEEKQVADLERAWISADNA